MPLSSQKPVHCGELPHAGGAVGENSQGTFQRVSSNTQCRDEREFGIRQGNSARDRCRKATGMDAWHVPINQTDTQNAWCPGRVHR